jgi:hypothetical protein
VVHYPDQSPVPMLLHSIMGVGTNFFPMGKELIPKLKTLMTPAEFVQVEAFPSVLRLTLGTGLLDELEANLAGLGKLKEVRFSRVIDNAPLTMGAEEFWVMMNYQVRGPVREWRRERKGGVSFCGGSGQESRGASEAGKEEKGGCCCCCSFCGGSGKSRAIGGRPPEPPLRPARPHMHLAAHVLGRA